MIIWEGDDNPGSVLCHAAYSPALNLLALPSTSDDEALSVSLYQLDPRTYRIESTACTLSLPDEIIPFSQTSWGPLKLCPNALAVAGPNAVVLFTITQSQQFSGCLAATFHTHK